MRCALKPVAEVAGGGVSFRRGEEVASPVLPPRDLDEVHRVLALSRQQKSRARWSGIELPRGGGAEYPKRARALARRLG
jgi:hypothetical protein